MPFSKPQRKNEGLFFQWKWVQPDRQLMCEHHSESVVIEMCFPHGTDCAVFCSIEAVKELHLVYDGFLHAELLGVGAKKGSYRKKEPSTWSLLFVDFFFFKEGISHMFSAPVSFCKNYDIVGGTLTLWFLRGSDVRCCCCSSLFYFVDASFLLILWPSLKAVQINFVIQ